VVAAAAVLGGIGVSCEVPVVTFAVNSTVDLGDAVPGDGVCEATPGGGNCTLRAAVDEANATEGLVGIDLANATYVLGASGGDLDVTGRISVKGAGTSVVDAACNGDRVFDVAASGELSLLSITVTGGDPTGDGGGIRSAGTLALQLSSVVGNVASGRGGGVAVTAGTATIERSTLEANAAGTAGGGVAVAAAATATVTNSTISGNSAAPPLPACGGSAPSLVEGGGSTPMHTAAPTSDPDIASSPSGRYLVQLDVATSAPRGGRDALPALQAAVAARTAAFTARAAATPATRGVDVESTYAHVPTVVVEATEAEAAALAMQPDVVSVQPDRLAAPHLAQSIPWIGADDVQAAGETGDGTAVVVVDTGVDATEPMTSGKVVAGACFARGSDGGLNGVGDCPGGVESATTIASSTNCPWFQQNAACWHGTHVASTAAGATRLVGGVPHTGVAPGADIISVQVFSHFTKPSACGAGITNCVLSWSSDQLAALDWVITQTGSFDIAAVNMSLGGGEYTSTCDSDPLKAPIDTLRTAGIATVISAGNSGSKTSVGSPGCISTAITVGATGDASDAIATFSQSDDVLDVLAPGVDITAEYPTDPANPGNDYVVTASGTSMAAPHVAGAVAVLHGADGTASVTEIEQVLEGTGVPVTDSNGLTRPRIDLRAAATELAAIGAGGGLSSEGTTTVRLSTIADNDAWDGGGVHTAGGTLTLAGSIVAAQAGGGDCATTAGASITSAGYNLASDASCWATGGTDQANGDAALGALADNGGNTRTHLPGAGADGRDVIPSGVGLCDGTYPNDQRLSARPAGSGCDSGAVEG
jgi:CSLREA domain-containing protein